MTAHYRILYFKNVSIAAHSTDILTVRQKAVFNTAGHACSVAELGVSIALQALRGGLSVLAAETVLRTGPAAPRDSRVGGVDKAVAGQALVAAGGLVRLAARAARLTGSGDHLIREREGLGLDSGWELPGYLLKPITDLDALGVQ